MKAAASQLAPDGYGSTVVKAEVEQMVAPNGPSITNSQLLQYLTQVRVCEFEFACMLVYLFGSYLPLNPHM